MDNPYYTKKNSEKSVMKALKEQRGKYDEVFVLWNAKQLELEEKRKAHRYEKIKSRVKDKNYKRSPNKTDYYD